MAKNTKPAADKNTVTLINSSAKKDSEREREFSVEHAQNLLKYQQEKGLTDWELPENSGFKYENGTIERADTGKTEKSDQPGSPN
jgi:hypothetical protein